MSAVRLQICVGSRSQAGTWLSFAPAVGAFAEGEDKAASIQNLLTLVVEIFELYMEEGEPLPVSNDGKGILQDFLDRNFHDVASRKRSC